MLIPASCLWDNQSCDGLLGGTEVDKPMHFKDLCFAKYCCVTFTWWLHDGHILYGCQVQLFVRVKHTFLFAATASQLEHTQLETKFYTEP
jgi:hypothetical protein